MSDGLLARWWPLLYQTSLPRHPELVEESTPERVPGLVDEAN
ncbi:hypothetical protein ACIBK9_47020 [Nonomuraea sp. NPDC050227]